MQSQSGGNRQDNRQRGNAAQLLEKYKSLARDSQLAGDRVQTESYLQFADHYHRVLSESRSRYEENNPRRQQNEFDEDEGDEENQVEAYGNGQNEPRQDQQDRPQREFQDRPQRELREPREPREFQPRPPRFEAESRDESQSQAEEGYRNGGEQQPRRERRPRREAAEFNGERNGETEERIAFDVLPPAIGVTDTPEAAEPAPRPRRTRRPRPPEANDGEEIAPAA